MKVLEGTAVRSATQLDDAYELFASSVKATWSRSERSSSTTCGLVSSSRGCGARRHWWSGSRR